MGPIMLDGICPKCQSTEVYMDSNVKTFESAYFQTLNKVVVTNGILAPDMVRFDNFLCRNCGYLERYVMDSSERDELTKHWKRVGQGQPSR
jgi:predicted nucleic-acid-binding Zn-ribbon protein